MKEPSLGKAYFLVNKMRKYEGAKMKVFNSQLSLLSSCLIWGFAKVHTYNPIFQIELFISFESFCFKLKELKFEIAVFQT